MVIQTVGAFLAVISFSLILELPKKYLILSGTIGAVGWLVYLLVQAAAGSVIAAAFLSTLLVALFSHISARVCKAPVTVFLVAGILPSVPGASIYRSVSYVISNDPVLSSRYLVETLQVSGAIAMAIFIMDSLFRLGKKK
ncbi:threonine/serine exporter family protein [Lacrimispora defluvii]|uniref:Threonine/serine exporter n=1 Tax=Lacrimispora defluvii TaxID=2719233 RepID=A0ABX1VJY4_9FIRM|nr:threonine/serine exporter family protein [Lacrimispora defluvii]NNJ28218.1 threonine/serine exporter [Lacrimispora defluvii]